MNQSPSAVVALVARVTVLFLSSLLDVAAMAQQGGPPPGSPAGLPQGVTTEMMWPAPTAKDWQKPVQITFQRTWEDALAVAQETNKPILVCINMDGEPASEHYAGIRYRNAEIGKLYEPYVCVIASVYRHNPRDYDEHGNRILCPRFGSVTCGEHIAIEPILYEKFMEGRRIAPRHIMVELDGSEKYDVFYAWDNDSVANTIRDGIANRNVTANPVVRGDRSIVERVQSRDVQDRNAVEQAYQQGDHELRQSLLAAAAAHPEAAPVDLLREAVFGFDADLGKQARAALARSKDTAAVPLIGDALKVPLPAAERDALITALEQLGDRSPAARMLAVVHQGMAQQHSAVDVAGWTKALAGAGSYQPASDPLVLDATVDHKDQIARQHPDNAGAQIELAEALLALATEPQAGRALASDPRTAQAFERLRFLDAERAGNKAEQLGAAGWRVDAVLAVCAWNLGKRDEAWQRAENAVKGLPKDSSSYSAMAVLQLFAEARQHAIAQAWRQKDKWPPQWLADVHAAYSVLLEHPFGTDQHVANHYDFLQFFGLGQAERVLEDGLRRFPDSPLLHQRLRQRVLAEKGVDGLQTVYDDMLQRDGAAPNLEWFAGYAGLVAAEFQRHAGKPDLALAAYDRAIAHYRHFVEQHPELRGSAEHYTAMALGGKARIRLEQGDLDAALALVQQSLQQRPEAAAARDGLNLSTVDTAKMLRQSLSSQQRGEQVAQLDAALAKLDPAQLELPAYERETPLEGNAGRRRGRRGR